MRRRHLSGPDPASVATSSAVGAVAVGLADTKDDLRQGISDGEADRDLEIGRYRISVSYLDDLATEVTRTGLSALSDATIAHKLGMAVARTTDLDGYINRDQIVYLIGRYFLADDAAGNVTLRVVNADNGLLRPGDVADLPAIALDLAESLDTRLNRAGHRYLDQLLGEL